MLTVVNPTTGETIREVPQHSSDDVKKAFEAAKEAQKSWAKQDVSERIEILDRFGKLLVEKHESLAEILTDEMGKPLQQSKSEIRATKIRVDFFTENCKSLIAEELVFEDPKHRMQEGITHEPLGVIANISAWNYPYFIGANVYVPALLTGNAVLYKASEFTVLSGLEMEALLKEAGLPDHLFQTIVGDGAIGAEILEQPIDGVFFTGSFATGSKIASAAASKMIKVQLELGGKDPIYVCDDVDYQVAAEGIAEGAFYNSGQSCCAVERIYVHESICDDFIEEFCDLIESYSVGDPKEDKTLIGPLTRKEQLDVLEDQVQDALDKGAKLVLGTGKRLDRPGNYFDPTVLANVDHSMKIMREESFGPVVGIQSVASDEDATRLMSDTEYGLTAGVYCNSGTRAEVILNQINCGTVYWNCCDRVSTRLPWSGRGHSGVGLTLSKAGITCFTKPKAWHWRSPD
ncbi:MAG: aldehyde dehydrogenase family protein [Planctomycetota bacterium]|nr:aldehyde dehydrogenase family protein [Planctomycetota bacterium]